MLQVVLQLPVTALNQVFEKCFFRSWDNQLSTAPHCFCTAACVLSRWNNANTMLHVWRGCVVHVTVSLEMVNVFGINLLKGSP